MNSGQISGRYARALYALADEQGQAQRVFTEMETLADFFFKLQGLSQAVANPIYSAADKEQLLITAAGANISDLMRQFIRFVIEKGREEFILFMAMSFQDIYRREKRIMLGKITSVTPLPPAVLNKLRQLIDRHYGSELQMSTATDPELIGGFVLEVGNSRFDASVRSGLRRIEEELTAG